MRVAALFTRHPAQVGETYTEHLASASGFAARLILAGAACSVHAVFPFAFEKTASRMVARLHERMVAGRGAKSPIHATAR
jgi:hypothetical protein